MKKRQKRVFTTTGEFTWKGRNLYVNGIMVATVKTTGEQFDKSWWFDLWDQNKAEISKASEIEAMDACEAVFGIKLDRR